MQNSEAGENRCEVDEKRCGGAHAELGRPSSRCPRFHEVCVKAQFLISSLRLQISHTHPQSVSAAQDCTDHCADERED